MMKCAMHAHHVSRLVVEAVVVVRGRRRVRIYCIPHWWQFRDSMEVVSWHLVEAQALPLTGAALAAQEAA